MNYLLKTLASIYTFFVILKRKAEFNFKHINFNRKENVLSKNALKLILGIFVGYTLLKLIPSFIYEFILIIFCFLAFILFFIYGLRMMVYLAGLLEKVINKLK